jgi:hypothetical protein
MRYVFLIALFLSGSGILLAQNTIEKRKSLYFELAGSGGLGSINYESTFLKKSTLEATWRLGLTFAPIDKNNGVGIVFPIMANALLGENAHKLELGLGQGITITTKGSFFLLTTATIGYRYQSPSKKWFYRATYTPLISYIIDRQLQHWGGLSIGYTFKTSGK